MRYVVVDTETTGLSVSQGHRVVSVAGVEMIDLTPTGAFMAFHVNPERDSDAGALAVHGLTTEFLSTKPKFGHIASSFLDFIDGAALIAHNAPFDAGFLNAEFERAGYHRERLQTWICTKAMAQRRFGRGGSGMGAAYPSTNRLDDLVRHFKIRDLRAEYGYHGALIDAVLLVEVYRALVGVSLPPLVDWPPKSMEQAFGRVSTAGESSTRVSAEAPASAVTPPIRDGGEGVGQDVQRAVGVHHAAEAGRTESGSATS